MSVLPFAPQFSSRAKRQPRVRKSGFGDGYEQRTADGLNVIRDEWDLVFTLKRADAESLLSFFDGLQGVSRFQWTAPGQSQALNYICDDWNYQLLSTGAMTINAHIYQDFNP